jgi:ABC-type enterochelin transport system permease subunit
VGTVSTIRGVVSVLVAVSTALVGLLASFGLPVASLAHALVGHSRHRDVLHDINVATWHSDHIVAMRAGRVCRQMTSDETVMVQTFS